MAKIVAINLDELAYQFKHGTQESLNNYIETFLQTPQRNLLCAQADCYTFAVEVDAELGPLCQKCVDERNLPVCQLCKDVIYPQEIKSTFEDRTLGWEYDCHSECANDPEFIREFNSSIENAFFGNA